MPITITCPEFTAGLCVMAAPVEIEPEKKIGTFLDGVGNYCALTDSGTYGVVTSSNGDALAIDCSKEESPQCHLYMEHKTAAQQCTISVFGRVAATASLDGTVQVWNTEKPSQVWKRLSYKEYDRALGVALSRDGNTLAACYQKRDSQAGVIVLYKMPEFEKITWWKTKKLDIYSGSIAISDDGTIVAHCSKVRAYAVQVQAAREFGVNNPKSHKKWNVSGEASIAMSGDGSTIAVADAKSIRVMSPLKDEETELRGYQRSFRAFCCISASGNRVAAAIAGNKFRIWNANTGDIVADICGFGHHTRGCALNQDGNILLSCSFDRCIFVTNITNAIEKAKQARGIVIPNESENTNEQESGLLLSYDSNHLEIIPERQIPTKISSLDPIGQPESEPEPLKKQDFSSEDKPSVPELIKLFEAEKNNDITSNHDLKKAEVKAQSKEFFSEEIITTEIVCDSKEEEEPESPLRAAIDDPREVFAKALERNNRKDEGNLLHVQASEALDELFQNSDMSKLDKYTKDDILLLVDTEKTWRINERQFLEGAIKVLAEIRASKTDPWTTAYIRAAEVIENKITIPQAMSIINVVLGDQAPEKSTMITTLESSTEDLDEITYKSFISALRQLGVDV